jgi:hypothetical protein
LAHIFCPLLGQSKSCQYLHFRRVFLCWPLIMYGIGIVNKLSFKKLNM